MRKKIIETYRAKSLAELEKDRLQMIREIALFQLDLKVNPPKDTNTLFKKRKSFAILATILQEKKAIEGKKK